MSDAGREPPSARPRWAVIAARPGFAAEETRDLLEWSGCTVRSTTAEGVVRIPLY